MKETIVLGGGCFWCTEAVFKRLKGVLGVTPGYAGGSTSNPTYEEVSSGNTGHAEVVRVEFDNEIISKEKVIEVFFASHDPTTRNRQGADVGSQYRSIILCTSAEQLAAINRLLPKLAVTEVKPLTDFYRAEPYHQDYYEKNKGTPYCTLVIDPKLRKLSYLFITPK